MTFRRVAKTLGHVLKDAFRMMADLLVQDFKKSGVYEGNPKVPRIDLGDVIAAIRIQMTNDLMTEEVQRYPILISSRPFGTYDPSVKFFSLIEVMCRNGQVKNDARLIVDLQYACLERNSSNHEQLQIAHHA